MTYTQRQLRKEFDKYYQPEDFKCGGCLKCEACMIYLDKKWELEKDFLSTSIHQVLAEERVRVRGSVNKTLDRYVVKKEPLCEQNSLILLIRTYLLSSLPLLANSRLLSTDKTGERSE